MCGTTQSYGYKNAPSFPNREGFFQQHSRFAYLRKEQEGLGSSFTIPYTIKPFTLVSKGFSSSSFLRPTLEAGVTASFSSLATAHGKLSIPSSSLRPFLTRRYYRSVYGEEKEPQKDNILVHLIIQKNAHHGGCGERRKCSRPHE